MRRSFYIQISALAWCGLCAIASPAFAQDRPVLVSNHQYGYSVRIPAGWQQVPAEILGEFARSILTEDSKVIFEAAFQPQTLETWFQYPYVLIQVTPYERLGINKAPDLTQIKHFVKQLSGFDVDAQQENLTDEARDLLSEASYHKAQFDETRLRVAYDADLDVPSVGTVRGRALGQFGRTAFVQVVFYDVLGDWLVREDQRKAILQSLAFSSESVLSLDPSIGGIEMPSGVVLGGIGGAVGAIGLGLLWRRKGVRAAP